MPMGKIAMLPEVGNKPITKYIEESQQGEPKRIEGSQPEEETTPATEKVDTYDSGN